MPTLFVVINCGACAPFVGKCLASLQAQICDDWQAYVTVDPCGDQTYEEAVRASGGDARIRVFRNEQQLYSLENLVKAIRQASLAPDNIILNLDADDWLNLDHALSIVIDTYARYGCWLTYGSWVSNVPDLKPGMWRAYPAGTENFREVPWLGTHLRTWKKWLWDLVNDRDLRDEDGRYFRAACDLAVTMPLLDMCGTRRARHIPDPVYCLNRRYSWRTDDQRYQEQTRNESVIRAKCPYSKLDERGS
jgi:glycosyltransferase involved in cell wall biosynthesis